MGATSSFPNGFANGFAVRGVPQTLTHPGRVFWVNNSSVLPVGGIAGSNSNDGSYLKPFSTLDYAVGRCVANRGDVIYVMPGYTQSMTAADAVDVDVAGVTIIGLGRGSKRPKFTYDNSAGEFVIGAANVHIENLWFVPSVTGITKAIDVESGAHFFEIVGCRFGDAEAAGTDEFNATIIVTTSTDGLITKNYINMGEAGAVAAITLTGACDRTEISENVIIGDYSTANINGITALSNDVNIRDNILVNGVTSGLNTEPAIEMLTGSSGWVANNRIASDLATLTATMVFDAAINFSNYVTDDKAMNRVAVDRSADMIVSADA